MVMYRGIWCVIEVYRGIWCCIGVYKGYMEVYEDV